MMPPAATEIPDAFSPGRLAGVAVLIPAWQPGPILVELVQKLVASGFGEVLVINDGSTAASQHIFDQLVPAARLLGHAVNLGKGRALKTGFNEILTNLPHIQGVITADADGQHTLADILRVADSFSQSPHRIVLGTRVFGSDVPLRSRFGNLLTRQIFGLMAGVRVGDTQTGLRALPRAVLASLMTLPGERYEYEMTMLAHLCRTGKRPLEVPIQTVYINGNRSSHFDPVWDSMRIYFVLLRFYFSSLVAAGIDLVGFSLAFAATHNLMLSVVIGRLSSVVNFYFNKRYVFQSHSPVKGTLWRYYALAVAIAASSYGLIWVATNYLHANVLAAKIVVDVLLSLVSFSAQQTFVFGRAQDLESE